MCLFVACRPQNEAVGAAEWTVAPLNNTSAAFSALDTARRRMNATADRHPRAAIKAWPIQDHGWFKIG
jgi:hypothetical protein